MFNFSLSAALGVCDSSPFTTPRETFHDHQKPQLMPSLDTRGKIAGAEIGFYVPIAVITLLLIFRYVLRRDAGWLFLFAFSSSKY